MKNACSFALSTCAAAAAAVTVAVTVLLLWSVYSERLCVRAWIASVVFGCWGMGARMVMVSLSSSSLGSSLSWESLSLLSLWF